MDALQQNSAKDPENENGWIFKDHAKSQQKC